MADAASVLDDLGADQFVTIGWSGGGPHALACAALLPGRCLAATSLAGVAPAQAAGLDWVAGMGPENIEEFGAAEQGEAALTAYLTPEADGLRQVTGEQVADELGGLVSAVDRDVVTAEFADYLAALFRAALSTGIAGWRDDDLAFVADWGFPAEQAGQVPVAVWQGDEDRMVPYPHGAWLAGHIPGARAHLLTGEGHLSLAVRQFGAVLDDLLDLAGRPAAPGPGPPRADLRGRPGPAGVAADLPVRGHPARPGRRRAPHAAARAPAPGPRRAGGPGSARCPPAARRPPRRRAPGGPWPGSAPAPRRSPGRSPAAGT